MHRKTKDDWFDSNGLKRKEAVLSDSFGEEPILKRSDSFRSETKLESRSDMPITSLFASQSPLPIHSQEDLHLSGLHEVYNDVLSASSPMLMRETECCNHTEEICISDRPFGRGKRRRTRFSDVFVPQSLSPIIVSQSPVVGREDDSISIGELSPTVDLNATYPFARTLSIGIADSPESQKLARQALRVQDNTNVPAHPRRTSYQGMERFSNGFAFGNKPKMQFVSNGSRNSIEGTKSWRQVARELKESIHTTVEYIDTHCHYDFIFNRLEHFGTFDEYMEEYADLYLPSYAGCVTNFCHPTTYREGELERWADKVLTNDKTWASFGIHPHNSSSYNDALDARLRAAVAHEKCVSVGEIGLDRSNRNNVQLSTQAEALRRQILVAKDLKKPLVIHCRDADEECIEILKQNLPRDWTIHRHCYTGNWQLAKRWLAEFPNLYMGLTPLVTFTNAASSQDFARNVPLDRLLLETDAPYFVPRSMPRDLKWSHPGLAYTVAIRVAELQSKDFEHVLQVTRENARKVYRI